MMPSSSAGASPSRKIRDVDIQSLSEEPITRTRSRTRTITGIRALLTVVSPPAAGQEDGYVVVVGGVGVAEAFGDELAPASGGVVLDVEGAGLLGAETLVHPVE